jgi:hypothetical protein
MIEQLFGSKTRVSMLRNFFRQPDKPFYVRELTRLLDIQINAIRREIELLMKLDLLKEIDGSEVGDKKAGFKLRKYYVLNTESILFNELQALILKSQLLEENELIKELESKSGKILFFLLTGRFTGDKRSPVDILMVGDLKETVLSRLIKKYETKFGFPIRYTTMSEKEFFERREMMDKFIYSIFEADNIKVINTFGI